MDGCKPVEVNRSTSNAAMEPARMVGTVFFPLDEKVGRTTGDLTPHAQGGLVRVPSARAAQVLERLVGVCVRNAGVQSRTTQMRKAVCEEWEKHTAQRKRNAPEAPGQASKQVMSADGAMVPLVGGVWADVTTMAIGDVETSEASQKQVQKLSLC